MNTRQSQAFRELCRHGFPLLAENASRCWDQGHAFDSDPTLRIPRLLETMIDQCNWELEREEANA